MTSNKGFCPILKSSCRRDCQWCDVVTILDEDGAEEELVCAITNIASFMLGAMVDEDGWIYYDGDE